MKEGRLSLGNYFRDILASVRMSRRRGFLSGLMTVWGVFIFIAVVGTSNGIDRGNRSNYDYILRYILTSYRDVVPKGSIHQFPHSANFGSPAI